MTSRIMIRIVLALSTLVSMVQGRGTIIVNLAMERCVRELELGLESRRLVFELLRDNCKSKIFQDDSRYFDCVDRVIGIWEDRDEISDSGDAKDLKTCLEELTENFPVLIKRRYNAGSDQRTEIRDNIDMRNRDRDREAIRETGEPRPCTEEVKDISLDFIEDEDIRKRVRERIDECVDSRFTNVGLNRCVRRYIRLRSFALTNQEITRINEKVESACLLRRRLLGNRHRRFLRG